MPGINNGKQTYKMNFTDKWPQNMCKNNNDDDNILT